MCEIQAWLLLASATSEFRKLQIFYHNISHFAIHISRFFPFTIYHFLFFLVFLFFLFFLTFLYLRQPRHVHR